MVSKRHATKPTESADRFARETREISGVEQVFPHLPFRSDAVQPQEPPRLKQARELHNLPVVDTVGLMDIFGEGNAQRHLGRA